MRDLKLIMNPGNPASFYLKYAGEVDTPSESLTNSESSLSDDTWFELGVTS